MCQKQQLQMFVITIYIKHCHKGAIGRTMLQTQVPGFESGMRN